MKTLADITEIMREFYRDHADGSECGEWQAFVADCFLVLHVAPWDDDADSIEVPEDFAAHWRAIVKAAKIVAHPTITAIRIERDDDFAGEWATDEDFSRFVAIYDAAEVAAVADAFGLPESAVEVVVHRNTSGMTAHLSWLEGGEWELEFGGESAAERIHEAVRGALTQAWTEYEEQQEARDRQAALDTARDLPEGWLVDADDGDSFTAFPTDLPEDRLGNSIGYGIGVQLDLNEYTDEPVRAYVIDAKDGEPGEETYTGSSAVVDAIDAAGAMEVDSGSLTGRTP